MSPFILHPVTANIFHPSGNAGGKGGCGWGLSRRGAGLPSRNVWALSALHFELFLTLSLVQKVLDWWREGEGQRGAVSHLGRRRCPFTNHAHGPHAGVGLPLRNLGRKARQGERGGGGDATNASATGRRPEHSAEGQDFLLLAFSPES